MSSERVGERPGSPGSEPETDVVVIGAGIVGLAVAYYLRREDRDVVLLDRGEAGAETSAGNCGLVTPSHADPLIQPASLRYALASLFDPAAPLRIRPTLSPRRLAWFARFAARCNDRARRVSREARWALLQSTRTLLEGLVADERLDCAWRPGGVLALYRSESALEEELAVLRFLRELGHVHETLDGDAVRAREPLVRDSVLGGVLTPDDAHLDPYRLARELRGAVERAGVTIAENTTVETIDAPRGSVTGVRTERGRIAARDVVVAAGPWSGVVLEPLGLRPPVEPAKGYSITWDAPVPGVRMPLRMAERKVVATPWPFGFRLGSTIEFVGHDARVDRRRSDLLLEGAHAYLDVALDPEAGARWAGLRPMSVDERPILGPSTRVRGLHLAIGHGQLGVSQCAASGRLVTERLTGAAPHLDPEPYDPGRFGL